LLFHKLWENFVLLARFALRRGARIAIEWPKNCRYWKFPNVIAFLEETKMKCFDFDGCMFGLKSSIAGGEHRPLRKSWKIATNLGELRDHLGITCDGRHSHARVRGLDAKHSENYTKGLASAVHTAFCEYAASIEAGDAPAVAVPCLPCVDVADRQEQKRTSCGSQRKDTQHVIRSSFGFEACGGPDVASAPDCVQSETMVSTMLTPKAPAPDRPRLRSPPPHHKIGTIVDLDEVLRLSVRFAEYAGRFAQLRTVGATD